MNTCWLFHKWGRWQYYEKRGTQIPTGIIFPKDIRGKEFSFYEIRQKRTCFKCGITQDKHTSGDEL